MLCNIMECLFVLAGSEGDDEDDDDVVWSVCES